MKRKLAENYKRIEHRVAAACERAGRDPAGVTIIAVTKSVSVDVIRALLEIGVTTLGESRVQELTRRAAMIDEWISRRGIDAAAPRVPRPVWHMVGHLQRNKIKTLLPWVDVIHSLDSLRLAEAIDAHEAKRDCVTPMFLQVNAANEPQKYGVAVAAVTHLAEQITTLNHIELLGLMAVAPLDAPPDRIRYVFDRVRELFEEIVVERICGKQFRHLSLGMSQDFEYAIEAGATHIRVGTALFEGIDVAPPVACAE